jgi:hypothetical protein
MRCVTCGGLVAESDRFCGACGATAVETMPTRGRSPIRRCLSCGTELDLEAGDRFCPNCGATVAGGEPSRITVPGSRTSGRSRPVPSTSMSSYRVANRAETFDRSQPDMRLSGQRPVAITVICILGFLGALLTIPLFMMAASLSMGLGVGSWYLLYLAFATVVGLACMVGLWRMKKWAAYTYAGFVAINQVVLIAGGLWTIFSLLIPAVVVIIALKYSPRMS